MIEGTILNTNFPNLTIIVEIKFEEDRAVMFPGTYLLVGTVFTVSKGLVKYFVKKMIKPRGRSYVYEIRRLDGKDFTEDDKKDLRVGRMIYRKGHVYADKDCECEN